MATGAQTLGRCMRVAAGKADRTPTSSLSLPKEPRCGARRVAGMAPEVAGGAAGRKSLFFPRSTILLSVIAAHPNRAIRRLTSDAALSVIAPNSGEIRSSAVTWAQNSAAARAASRQKQLRRCSAPNRHAARRPKPLANE